MENQLETNLKHIHELLSKGQFIEAMETYLHDDVELIEANDSPKKGKQFCIDFEDDFISNKLAEFIRYEVGQYAINGNYSYYDAIMELKMKDGSTMLAEQVVHTEWKDGKIYRERYYHA
ncbi:MAG: SnoaL-like domain-containing protein [Bacteroidota bacterium]